MSIWASDLFVDLLTAGMLPPRQREPYQVLVDAEIVKDASRFKMDLVPALERTLHGKVKPSECPNLLGTRPQPGPLQTT
jgi:hypothetical protein